MVIVRKVPSHLSRTANWLQAELDLSQQLAALGFFSSDEDTASTSSSSSASEAPRLPKKRYGGISSRRQPSVSAGLIRDVGRKRVGWRRQRRLDNEMAVVYGTDEPSSSDNHAEGVAPELRLELFSTPPSAPLASLFRDSDALQKWTEFAEQREDEQQKQLDMLLQSEQKFAATHGAVDSSESMDAPQNFQKALAAAKRQLRKVGRPLCKTLRRLSSPQLMASIENELLARMGDAASSVQTTSDEEGKSLRPVTCCWQTSSVFKSYTERITLDALCRYYGYQYSSRPLESLVEESEEASGEGDNKVAKVDVSDTEVIEIHSKHWHWPPVRLANVFFLNQQQQVI